MELAAAPLLITILAVVVTMVLSRAPGPLTRLRFYLARQPLSAAPSDLLTAEWVTPRWRAIEWLLGSWVDDTQQRELTLGQWHDGGEDGLDKKLICWWDFAHLNIASCAPAFARAVLTEHRLFDSDGAVVGSLLPGYLLELPGSSPSLARLRRELYAAINAGPVRVNLGTALREVAGDGVRRFAASQGDPEALRLALRALQLELFVFFTCGMRLTQKRCDSLLHAYSKLEEGIEYRACTMLPWGLPTAGNRQIWNAAKVLMDFFREAILAESGER